MEKKSKKSIIIGITSLLLVTLILLGLTYAYYRTRIIGNTNDKSISVTSKLLEVTYSDDNSTITATGIEPGYTTTKIFSVTNTGDATVNYSIVLDNVVNEFVRAEDWTYTLKKGDTIVLENKQVPLSKTWIVNSVSIDSGVTDEYTLTINYANLTNIDQSEDMGKGLSFRVNIDDEVNNILTNATEGTLLAAIGNDNVISDPVTVPGKQPSGGYSDGVGISKTYDLSKSNQSSRYYAYADSYTFDEKSGTYSLNNPKVATYAEISTNLVGKYVKSWFPSDSNIITTSGLTTICKITNAPAASTTSSVELEYTMISVTGGAMAEAVLASTEDDYGESYYFRGSVENNYVTYAGMCWRIVRVQGDGGIKLVLADRDNGCKTEEGYDATDGQSAFIADPSTQAFWYGGNYIYETSDINAVLNAWINGGTYKYAALEGDESEGTFTQKISAEEQEKLMSTEWCSDTTVIGKRFFNEDWDEIYETDENFNELLYASEVFHGAIGRLENRETAEPSLKCNFNGLDNTKSTKYESNIGILSADEFVFAGVVESSKNNFYLKTNALELSYWTLTPASYEVYYDDIDGIYTDNENIYVIDELGEYGGSLYSSITYDGDLRTIRPSVVLRSDVTIVSGGNGTQSNPYVIN